MKKCYLLFSLLLCLFMTQHGYAQQFDGGYEQDQWSGAQAYESNDYAFNGDQCCPQQDQPVSCVCYCKYCRMKPCYYNTTRCEYEPKYTCKKCCRFVPEYYQKCCCKYVPQYYYKTCCRQVPQYYYTQQCHYCPKYVCERHCKYVPEYYYKRSCVPCGPQNSFVQQNNPCPQPCGPAGCQPGPAYGGGGCGGY